MPQSNVIFGFLAVAFLIWITQKGEVGIYWGFLVSSPSNASSSTTALGPLSLANPTGIVAATPATPATP
jgi:hypothetical protein